MRLSKRIIIMTFTIVVVVLCVAGCSSTASVPGDESTGSRGTSKEWTEIARWSGSEMKTTETFTSLGEEFRVKWSVDNESFEGAGFFVAYVNNENGQMVSMVGNKQGTGSDISYVKEGPGRYYLEINSGNVDWEVSVEEQQ